MTMPDSCRVARTDTVVFTELEDEVVMLDTEKGLYYELDAVGARIWVLLEGGTIIGSLHSTLIDEFDVDADTCRDDLIAFLEELGTLGLVRLVPEGLDAE